MTRAADRAEGGFVNATTGNDAYLKTVASYNTGLMDSGFSTTVLLSQTRGDGYADGTKFQGYNYYVGLGYRPNETHDFQFTVTGAPQWHHQRSFASTIENYIAYSDNDDPNIKYNENWGYLNGEEYSFTKNFYHKPIMSLNWDYKISPVTTLSSSFYASFGRGGGSGEIGTINGRRQYALPRTADGLVRVEDIYRWNSGQSVPDFGEDRIPVDGQYLNQASNNSSGTNGISRRASINSHNWFGVLSNLSNKLSDNLTLDVGIDLRSYKGIHYRRVNDLMGADGFIQTKNVNNTPNPVYYETYPVEPSFWVFADIDKEQKIDYYNDGLVRWAGTFGQLEYVGDQISAFVQGSISNQGFKRVEYFTVPTAQSETDWKNIIGGNIKGGLNYNIDEMHNFYANAGYYSKQPLFDAVYINFGNTLNPDLKNETVIGTEVGYGFRSHFLSANVNLYRTSWADRFESASTVGTDGTRGVANIYGVTQVHTGVEVDANARITDKFTLTGMFSAGNWVYQDNVTASFFDENQNPILNDGVPVTGTLELDGVKVGDAAQLTASLGARYEIFNNWSIDGNYRYADNLYAAYNATNALNVNNNPSFNFEALELPSFGLLDLGSTFKVNIGENSLDFRLNVNNVLDTVYISEADTNIMATPTSTTYDGIDVRNRVYFGFGRTWTGGVTYRF